MAEARPAKDLKPTGARAKFLIEGKQRQLRKSAQEMRKKAKAQAKDKQPKPAKDIQKGSAREKILKDSRAGKIKAKPPASGASAKGTLGTLVKGVAKRAVPAIGFIVDASPAQAPAPKKGERLMRGMPQVGYGSKTSSADYGYKAKSRGPVGGARPEMPGSYPKASRSVGGARPETPGAYQATKSFKEKNLAANQKAGKSSAQTAKVSASGPAAAPRKAREMTFQEAVRRNVTEEYMKKKMRPKKSLLGSLRKKGNN